MVRRHAVAALLLLSGASFGLAQDRPFPLTVGDPAPPLTISKFVKGTPISSFEKGKIYVVDMWATWCGPCRRSIPEITGLAAKYGDKVQFLGVSIWENDQSGIAPFVQKMGDKMAYNVAEDQVATSANHGRDGVMAKTWMDASGMREIGIPTCFVIGGDGDIAWIGHPDNLAKPLDEIVNGTFDRNAFATTFSADMVKLKAKSDVMTTYKQAIKDKNWTAAEASADKLIALDPSSALSKFDLYLIQEKDLGKALTYGNDIQQNLFKDDPDSQTELAWAIANYTSKDAAKAGPWKDGLDLALRAAQRAVEIDKHKDSTYLMVLARVYHVRGDKDLAVSSQKEAISLATDPATKESLQKDLKEWEG